ncbi:DUF3050 domain-containing protein [Maribacter aurantiacus]|uniref:DUF3050 domain-containing protein n=1 Tax=Maribacter aurantiacus TaxID=1882343 RepID=A0A5R8M9Y2_9FLAO|nr:DUF3050 domain-containing protein [Maribacter aurantiacus]TLF46363.1 DUF3050 domain-containing protein [Maribacter aurantiacus]
MSKINIEKIEKALEPLRTALKNHQLYNELTTIADVRIFMDGHVYAVWDFMSLLKALQINLTCVTTPWIPSKNTNTARFINEIVLEEETDRDQAGNYKSHFEMYLEAMQEVDADTNTVEAFIDTVKKSGDIQTSIFQSELPDAVKEFMQFTFDVIAEGKAHKIAAAFTFGREELIPDMFLKIIESNEKAPLFPKLEYYLKRHIELDGDEHGPLSLKMIMELCGNDPHKWDEVLEVSQRALERRIQLWDGITDGILSERTSTATVV